MAAMIRYLTTSVRGENTIGSLFLRQRVCLSGESRGCRREVAALSLAEGLENVVFQERLIHINSAQRKPYHTFGKRSSAGRGHVASL